MFNLLHQEELAAQAFELLERLPADEETKAEMVKFEGEFKNVLDISNPYIYLYKLYIIEQLLHSDSESSEE